MMKDLALENLLKGSEADARWLDELNFNVPAEHMRRLVAIVKRQADALSFYSDTKNYDEAAPGKAIELKAYGEPSEWDFEFDCGSRAQAAEADCERIAKG